MTESDLIEVMEKAAKLTAQAEARAKQRDWQIADDLFQQAVSLDPSPSSRIAYGMCLAEQERYFESISVFMPVMDGTDRTAIGIVCHNLAAIYREVGDFDLARRFQWRSTLLQDDTGSADLLGLANDALMSDHVEVAASLVMSALELSEDDDSDDDGDLIATAGLIKARLNSVNEGLITILAAYRRHQAVDDFRRMGMDQLNMATLFAEANRHRAERSCVKRAIRCFEQAPAPYSVRLARQQLATLDRMDSVRSFDAGRN